MRTRSGNGDGNDGGEMASAGCRTAVAAIVLPVVVLGAAMAGCAKTEPQTVGSATTVAPNKVTGRAVTGQITARPPDPDDAGHSGDTDGTTPPRSPLDELWAFRSDHMSTCVGPSTPVYITVGTDPVLALTLTLDGTPVAVAPGGGTDIQAALPCDGGTHTLALTIALPGEDVGEPVTIEHSLPTSVQEPGATLEPRPGLANLGIDNEVRRCPFPGTTTVEYETDEANEMHADLDGSTIDGSDKPGTGSFQVPITCETGSFAILSLELVNDHATTRHNSTLVRVPA